MKTLIKQRIPAALAGVLILFNASAEAAVVFSEDFNGFINGNQNATQVDSGLLLSFGGDLPVWNKAGGGVVHAVNLNGRGNYAPMIWQDNVITLAAGTTANDSGVTYTVDFVAGPTVYAGASQATDVAEGLVIDVLRGDDTVLASHTHMPGAWAAAQTMSPASFTYTGDGSGDVRFRVGPLIQAGRFNGAIDDLRVSRGTVVFGENFNEFINGNQNATQVDSGLLLSFGGDVPGWDKAGGGVVHAVDLDGVGNYAPMIWQDNVITRSMGTSANDSGVTYTVDFVAGPTVYAGASQATGADEALVIDILRGDNSILATHTHMPGAWAGAQTMTPASFNYTGDGSGDIRYRIGPLLQAGRFNGAIDDFVVSIGGALPPPTIVGQPAGGTVQEGDDFSMSVAATSSPRYQWFKDATPIPGATMSTYVIVDVSPSDAGSYTVTVTNPAGSETSDPAVVTVDPTPVFGSYLEAVLTSLPVHYYPLDDTSGPTALDFGQLATTGGSFSNAVSLGESAPSSRLGTAVGMDGSSGTLVDLGSFHPGDEVSVEAWFLIDQDASTPWTAIGGRWDGSYELAVHNTLGVSFAVRNDSGAVGQAWSASVPERGKWHHAVGIFAGGTVRVYLDGVKGGDVPLGGVLQDAGHDSVDPAAIDRVLIGATRDGVGSIAFNLKGVIDEFAVYDYALSAAQIRGHYRAALPDEPPSLASVDSVLISWPTSPAGFQLHAAPAVDGTYGQVPGAPFIQDGMFELSVPVQGTDQSYFQLIRP